MPAPPPSTVFRYHAHPVHAAAFSTDNTLLYAGDEEGWLSITDTKTKRVVAHWRAHEKGVLAVKDWQGGLVSHGRDNIIHFHEPLNRASAPAAPTIDPSSNPSSSKSLVSTTATYRTLLSPPRIIRSLPVNSLNFCGFDLVPIPTGFALNVPAVDELEEGGDEEDELRARAGQGKVTSKWKTVQGLLAVPNLTDSETVDIYHIPSFGRLHAAVTTLPKPINLESEGKIRSGLVMSLRLYFSPSFTAATSPIASPPPPQTAVSTPTSPEPTTPALCLVAAFEDGRVERWENLNWQKRTDPRMRGAGHTGRGSGEGWRRLWRQKGHNEAIMAMTISPTFDYAYTVSADHQVVKYNLQARTSADQTDPEPTRFPTKQIGNSAVAVSPDGRVVAVGGWDGSIRLYSARTFKSLGRLAYHRQTVQTIAFPHLPRKGDLVTSQDDSIVGTEDETPVIEVVDEEDEDYTGDEEDGRANGRGICKEAMRWMVSGGKDRRLALWQLKEFSRR